MRSGATAAQDPCRVAWPGERGAGCDRMRFRRSGAAHSKGRKPVSPLAQGIRTPQFFSSSSTVSTEAKKMGAGATTPRGWKVPFPESSGRILPESPSAVPDTPAPPEALRREIERLGSLRDRTSRFPGKILRPDSPQQPFEPIPGGRDPDAFSRIDRARESEVPMARHQPTGSPSSPLPRCRLATGLTASKPSGLSSSRHPATAPGASEPPRERAGRRAQGEGGPSDSGGREAGDAP